jgi:hypothetical protein
MQHLDAILTGLVIVVAATVIIHRFAPRRRKSDSTCGGNCGCPGADTRKSLTQTE